MKRLLVIIISGFFLFPLFAMAELNPAPANVEGAYTLKDCYDLALRHSDTLAIQKELINETEGIILQSLSTALPKVAFAYSQKWQDLRPGNTFEGSVAEGKFTFSQPLFTGFKEIAAIRASRHIGKQRAAELQRAKELLFTDVADAFYFFWSYQQDLLVQEDTRKALLERVEELKKRQVIGRSRLSEVASAESGLMRLEAAMETVRGQMETAGQLLEFLIGRPCERVVDMPLPVDDSSLADLLAQVDERSDVLAVRESLASFQNNLTVARSAFFPTVSLNGNSYTQRFDTNEGNDWDVTLSVNVPLFNGLYDVGLVRQARSRFRSAQLGLEEAERKARLQITSAYVRWQTSLRRVAALKKALEASQTNYNLQMDDFKKSLVTNLDVLQSLQDLYSVRAEDVSTRAEAWQAFWSLKVAAGGDLP